MNTPKILPNAEPFFFPGGSTGCLLVHGFTGAPAEMRLLGEYLHEQGHTVLGVRLAGHGTDVKDMIRTQYKDWLASVEDGWNLLQGHTERVFVIGLSLGGILSLTFAAKFPVAGVVAMSAPYEMPNKMAKTMGPLMIPLSKIIPTMKKVEDFWFNPEMEKDHVCYPTDPVRPAYEFIRLLKVMRSLLPTIQAPGLVIQSKDDATVLPENGIQIFENLGSRDKEHVWVEKANHVITRDGDTSKVFQPIAKFIQTYLN